MAFIGNNPKSNTQTLTPQSTRPSNPTEGMIYYDDGTTFTEGLTQYKNGAWEVLLSQVGIQPARYNSNAGTSIANNSYTTVNYEDLVKDDGSYVTTGASWVYTVPAAGWYHVNARVGYSWALSAGNSVRIRVYKNGTTQIAEDIREVQTTATLTDTIDINTIDYFSASDTIAIQVYQNSGGALSTGTDATNNYVSIHKVD